MDANVGESPTVYGSFCPTHACERHELSVHSHAPVAMFDGIEDLIMSGAWRKCELTVEI